MLKITDYADKLIEGLNDVDYIERVKVQQKNWIGRSTGAEVDFSIKGKEDKLRIYYGDDTAIRIEGAGIKQVMCLFNEVEE